MKLLTLSTLLFLSLGLSSCAPSGYISGPYIPSEPQQDTAAAAKRAAELQQSTIKTLLQQSANSASPMKEYYSLQAAYLLTEQRHISQAQAIVSQLNSANYSPESQYLAKLVNIDILRQQGQLQQATQEMQALQGPPSLSLTTQIISHELKANLSAQQGDNLNSIREHIIIDSLLTNPSGQKQNRERTWVLVKSLPPATLVNMQQHNRSILDGWLALGAIENQYQNSPELAAQLDQWKATYPNHPANSILNTLQPVRQESITEIKAIKPYQGTRNIQQLGVLLPLSGKLGANGTSIRDGLITAYNASGESINIKVYDTNDDKNTLASYEQAVQEGADLVIGPLTKGGVTQINTLRSLPVPVLTLNYIQALNRHPAELYEFGLAPEDEARQAARFALERGQRRALILVQADEWGGRVSGAFTDEWYSLGGQPPIKIVFSPSDNINNVVRQALKIQLSAEQKERLTSQPERRQDIDMIFLGTQASVARQIKPLLDFYYANDLPIYGTSSIYSLPPNPTLDRDLNGVYVCDMPWIVSPQTAEPRLHATVDELWPSAAATYARFFALGIDAYDLSTHLSRLKGQPLPGVTAELYLSNDGRIERKVQCAQFKNGTPQL